jgi:hypothetical protein
MFLVCPCVTLALAISGCVSPDVATEVDAIGASTRSVSSQTLDALEPQIRAYKAAAPRRAAQNGDVWLLSEACDRNAEVFDTTSLEACKVEKIPNAGAGAVAPTSLQAVERKLQGLSEYMTLLADLAGAETEAEVKVAFGNLVGSLEKLGDQTSSDRIATLAEILDLNSKKVDAVVDTAVSALRARLLRQVVTEAHPAVARLTGEIKAQLLALNFDQEFLNSQAAMFAANDAALAAVPAGDVDATEAAFKALEARHKEFKRAADNSIYTQLDRLAEAHGGLRARLSQRPSKDDLARYVRALKDLKATLKE